MKVFPLRDTGFQIEAISLSPGAWGLRLVYPEVSFLFPGPEEWLAVLEKVLIKLEEKSEIQLRLEKCRFEDLISELPKLGFKMKHERVEFATPVDELVGDDGTPLKWKTLGGEWTMEEAAKALHAVAIGDPDYDPSEDALAGLKYYLSDSRFKSSPDWLQIGLIDEKLAALVIVQVKAEDGWSRITYMGVHPDFRGKDIGKWVHRKGFQLMKQMGGKTYFGGTVSTNRSMLKLFNENGCKEFRTLQEWVKRS